MNIITIIPACVVVVYSIFVALCCERSTTTVTFDINLPFILMVKGVISHSQSLIWTSQQKKVVCLFLFFIELG